MRKLISTVAVVGLIFAIAACTTSRRPKPAAPLTTEVSPDPSLSIPPPTSAETFSRAALLTDLHVQQVTETTHPSTPEPLGDSPDIVCVDHEPLRVYEYSTFAERTAHSSGIGPTGSEIRSADGLLTMVDWVGVPHFYARGRVVVLYLGNTRSLIGQLTHLLGPTLSPSAVGSPATTNERC